MLRGSSVQKAGVTDNRTRCNNAILDNNDVKTTPNVKERNVAYLNHVLRRDRYKFLQLIDHDGQSGNTKMCLERETMIVDGNHQCFRAFPSSNLDSIGQITCTVGLGPVQYRAGYIFFIERM